MVIHGQDRSGVDGDVHNPPETGKGGQWPEWLSAREAEVYSLQVHQYKIKEKTWRRQTHKEPSAVKWRDENTPTGTRYVFYRPDVDSYVVDRRKETDDAMARSRMVKDRHDRTVPVAFRQVLRRVQHPYTFGGIMNIEIRYCTT